MCWKLGPRTEKDSMKQSEEGESAGFDLVSLSRSVSEATDSSAPYWFEEFDSHEWNAPRQRAIGPDDSIRDTKPILEDSLRGALCQMSDEELQAASDWANSWTTDHVSAVKRWVARGPINDEMDRRRSWRLGDKKTD